METYAATYGRDIHDFDIDTIFWGALIVVALVVACLLVGKAIEWLRNWRKFDGAGAVNQQRVPATPAEPITAQSRPVTKPHRRLTEPVDGDTVEGGHIKEPEDDPLVDSLLDRGTAWQLTNQYRGDEWTDMAGFSDREEEEFLLVYGPKKVRKAIKERRKAREQVKKQSKGSN